MPNYLIEEETLTDIANAIREQTGTDDSIKSEDMSNMIRSIEGGGGASDAVRYNTAQSLTDEQKAQARENIGALDSSHLSTIVQEVTEAKNLASGASQTATNASNKVDNLEGRMNSGEFKGEKGKDGAPGKDGANATPEQIAEAVDDYFEENPIPSGGGGVTPTLAEKIVDYTVGAEEATARTFSFTVEEYPKLSEYNHLRGIFKKSTNGNMPWVQIMLNATNADDKMAVGKAAPGAMGMCGFDVTKHGSYYRGGMSAATNTSLYTAWTTAGQFPPMTYSRLTPLYIENLTMISIGSYTTFLDEGGRIEIWGWNE